MSPLIAPSGQAPCQVTARLRRVSGECTSRVSPSGHQKQLKLKFSKTSATIGREGDQSFPTQAAVLKNTDIDPDDSSEMLFSLVYCGSMLTTRERSQMIEACAIDKGARPSTVKVLRRRGNRLRRLPTVNRRRVGLSLS